LMESIKNGYFGNLTKEQEEMLQNFKNYINEIQNDEILGKEISMWKNSLQKCKEPEDATLLRFLRARNFDLEQAKALLREVLIWRRDSKVYEITEKDIQNELRYGKSFIHSFDKDGRILVYCQVKKHLKNTHDPEETKVYKIRFYDILF